MARSQIAPPASVPAKICKKAAVVLQMQCWPANERVRVAFVCVCSAGASALCVELSPSLSSRLPEKRQRQSQRH